MRNDAPTYHITFDGGSLGNPGKGYGSYELSSGADHEVKRLSFGDHITNNEAEYRTLIAALADLIARIEAAGADPKNQRVAIRGDSQLVINQVNGVWKVKTPHIRPLHAAATSLLDRFGSREVRWHARANSVRALGH